VDWVAERTLAIAGDDGVAIHSLVTGAAPITVDGADALVLPRRMPACAAQPVQEPAAEIPDELD
jgi:hypothetical protein